MSASKMLDVVIAVGVFSVVMKLCDLSAKQLETTNLLRRILVLPSSKSSKHSQQVLG